MQAKQVSLLSCDGLKVKSSVGLVQSGCGAHGQSKVTSGVAEINGMFS